MNTYVWPKPWWYRLAERPWRFIDRAGLWGGYTELRLAGPERRRKAPYLFFLDNRDIHRVTHPSRSHTPIFIGFGEKTDEKYYFPSTIARRHWTDHVKVVVERL